MSTELLAAANISIFFQTATCEGTLLSYPSNSLNTLNALLYDKKGIIMRNDGAKGLIIDFFV
jgi:hypothetical protein